MLLHLAPGTKEDTASGLALFEDLKRRGLADPLLVVTDGAPELIRAVETCFPRALRQRCLAHRLPNLHSKAPDRQWPEIAIRARGCYEAASPALAMLLRDDFVHAYERELPAVVACFRDDFEACIAHLRFPLQHRKVIRTTNLLERLFLEERRRTKIIPHAFGERPVLKLMYKAVIRAADRWRGITVGEFEQRQLRAIRDELNRAHATRIAPAVMAPKPAGRAQTEELSDAWSSRGRPRGSRIDDRRGGRYLATPRIPPWRRITVRLVPRLSSALWT
jgi:putative transposase